MFQNYIKNHFARHAGITRGNQEPLLLLFDGHRSHISLTLQSWAKERNIILFVLPPHTSHVTQPLDVGVFGPLKKMYYAGCSDYMLKNPGASVTKYDLASLTCKPYLKAMSAENLISAFRKTGVFPVNKNAILPVETTQEKYIQMKLVKTILIKQSKLK